MPTTPPHATLDSRSMPSLIQATVADAMHRGIVSCEPDMTLAEVARMMSTNHVHCIVVVGVSHHNGSERLVWGVISDLDVVRAGIRTTPDELAGALAKQPIITVEPDTSLREAGELMLTRRVSHVVVIERKSQRPLGILSTLDIARVLASAEA